MGEYCCERMQFDLEQECDQHPDRKDCPDALIRKDSSGYGLIIHDGGTSVIEIEYCPWCGSKLASETD